MPGRDEMDGLAGAYGGHIPPAPPKPDEEDQVRQLHPMKFINRGEDTLADDDTTVVFSDFRPSVLPADLPDEEVVVVPKDSSALELADSLELSQELEETTVRQSVQAPVPKASGTVNPDVTGKPTSSSPTKTG